LVFLGLTGAWAALRWGVARPAMETSARAAVEAVPAENVPAAPPVASPAPPGEDEQQAVATPGPSAEAPPSGPAPASTASRTRALQVGAFLSADNAEVLRARLAQQYGDVYVRIVERDGRSYHRVFVGGLASGGEQHAVADALRRAGYAPTAVME